MGPGTTALPESIGSKEDKQAALDAARESIILLKNQDNLLPLSTTTKRILMTGEGCSSLGYQTGGWSIHWQGAQDSEFVYGVSQSVRVGRSVTKSLGFIMPTDEVPTHMSVCLSVYKRGASHTLSYSQPFSKN